MITASSTLSRSVSHQLDSTQRSLNQAIERLSSGQRVNAARDDAAGLAISNRMEAQVRGTKQARRNINDGETPGVDLDRPGFSVDALGLTDFTVAGISGEVTDFNIVAGRARDDDGNIVFFESGGRATHDTATDTSQVSTSIGQQLYAPVSRDQDYQIEDVDSVFLDHRGAALEGDHQLVKTGSRHFIQHGRGLMPPVTLPASRPDRRPSMRGLPAMMPYGHPHRPRPSIASRSTMMMSTTSTVMTGSSAAPH